MQGDVGEIASRGAAAVQHSGREVQTGGRRGNRTPMLCKDGLIALAIRGFRRAMNVRRQGNPAQLLDLQGYRNLLIRAGVKSDGAFSTLAFLLDFSFEMRGEQDAIASPDPLGGLGENAPARLIRFQRAKQKELDFSAIRTIPAAMKARGKNACVVQNQAIAGSKVGCKVFESRISECVPGPINHQHPGGTALRKRRLGNQFLRQIIMEVGNLGQTVILGIETSCDETAAAVVDENGVRSSVIASQFDVHATYGGVVPELASREHLRAIVPVVRQTLSDAGLTFQQLSAIAVTAGPGLIGSLLVGVTYAKALCFSLDMPLIAVNHVEGHIHSVLLENKELELPALALVVSGGHTHLFAVTAPGEYRLLGKTRDDAAGEAYDKVAKLLGFGYPGGPIVDRVAAHGNPKAVRFSLAKMKGNALDFSFSGLKTAVLRWKEAQPGIDEEIARRQQNQDHSLEGWLAVTPERTRDLLASFQATVIRELLGRALVASEEMGAQSVIVAGGVACNSGLRNEAANQQTAGLPFYFPGVGLATDNAAMIAAAALPKFQRGDFAGFDLRANPNLTLA